VVFFKRGKTCAVLKCEGKDPSESDRLTTDVIGVTRTSMQLFSKEVGIGSRSEDLQGALRTRRRTSSSVTVAKSRSSSLPSGGLGFARFESEFGFRGKEERIFVILFRKNDPKASASEGIEEQFGRCILGQR
jgi:hypothetical protein